LLILDFQTHLCSEITILLMEFGNSNLKAIRNEINEI
jgi:hypothetical protein